MDHEGWKQNAQIHFPNTNGVRAVSFLSVPLCIGCVILATSSGDHAQQAVALLIALGAFCQVGLARWACHQIETSRESIGPDTSADELLDMRSLGRLSMCLRLVASWRGKHLLALLNGSVNCMFFFSMARRPPFSSAALAICAWSIVSVGINALALLMDIHFVRRLCLRLKVEEFTDKSFRLSTFVKAVLLVVKVFLLTEGGVVPVASASGKCSCPDWCIDGHAGLCASGKYSFCPTDGSGDAGGVVSCCGCAYHSLNSPQERTQVAWLCAITILILFLISYVDVRLFCSRRLHTISSSFVTPFALTVIMIGPMLALTLETVFTSSASAEELSEGAGLLTVLGMLAAVLMIFANEATMTTSGIQATRGIALTIGSLLLFAAWHTGIGSGIVRVEVLVDALVLWAVLLLGLKEE